MQILKHVFAVLLVATLVACGGGGGSAGTTTSTSTTTSGSATTTTTSTSTSTISTATASVSSLGVQASPTSIASAGGSSSVTVYAINSSNAFIEGATINLSATGGLLSASSVTTDASGKAVVTLTPGFTDQSNRIAVITATSNGKSAVGQVTITGGSIALNSSVTSLAVGATTLVTATVKDQAGSPVMGVNVTFVSSNTALVSLSAGTVTTNASGVATVIASGLSGPGAVTVSAAALGTSQGIGIATTIVGSGFYFASPATGVVVQTGGAGQTINVQANGSANVTFASTLGVFTGSGTNIYTAPVVANVATATLVSAAAGQATVQAVDPATPGTKSAAIRIVYSQPVAAANKILLNADKTIVPVSNSTTQNTVGINARTVQIVGGVDQPVANVPVLFTLTGGPGGGEYLTVALAYSDASGFATTTFVAGSVGSIPSGTAGLRIHAQIFSTAIASGTAPSSNDVLLTIGGKALSVAFGGATTIESPDSTTYRYPFSVQVTDANGNGVSGTTVSLSVKPFAWSTGGACTIAASFCSEDLNGNGSLDAGEDGTRTAYTAGTCSGPTSIGNMDGLLTPVNSDAGSVPSTVTTADAGIAPFNLTYLKGRAIWMVVKMTATVNSNGTEASASTIFRLPAAAADVTPLCVVPDSPFIQ
jgi:hypothetical protein